MYVSGLQSLDVALNRGARLPLLLWLMGIPKLRLCKRCRTKARRLGSSSCVSSDLNEIVRLRDVGPRGDPEAILDNSELLLLSSKSRGSRLVVF